LLSENAVLKTDRSGRELATYHFQFGQGFEPVSLGVTGHSLYLVDRTSRVERFPVH